MGLQMKSDLAQLIDIVEEISGLMLEASSEDMGTKQKSGRRDLVTRFDAMIQEKLVDRLGKTFPDAGFLCEEGEGLKQIEGLRFIIDPIDGTSNFVHGTGCSATSVALVEDDRPLISVVRNPFTGETFSASAGDGAWLNGDKMPQIEDSCLADSLVCVGSSLYFPELYQETMDLLARRGREFNDIRRDGSAALDCCYTADGRYGLFFEKTLAPWDYAAGSLVAIECGAHVSNMEGKPLTYGERNSVLIATKTAAAEWLAG
ncbi:MAG: inositol monophosphatase family protein [Coriobacteriales bacterium]